MGACAALAWPAESPVAAQPGGTTEGDRVWAWAFAACAAGAFAAYVGGLLALRRHPPPLGLVAVLAAAIQLVPLAAPLLLSTDAWTYWSYGRIAAVQGGNPYADAPSAFPADPSVRYVGADWRDATSVYGPVFTLASEPLARAAGESAAAAAWAAKAAAAAATLAAAGLAARVSRHRRLALALVGWNPLLALHMGGGGHNDAWMAALVLCALALAATGRRRLAGAGWALAVLVKWIPLLFLPLHLLAARARTRRLVLAGFAVAAAVLTGAAFLRYGSVWLGTLGPLARNARTETSFAVPHRLEQLGVPRSLAIALLAAAFVVVYAWLLREARRGRARLGLAAGAALMATPYLAPWYAIWALPLAAAEDDTTAQWLAVALSAYLLPQTIVT